jgi:hypothetical protein
MQIKVENGMTYDVKGNLVMNITPEEWENALKERRVIINQKHVSASGMTAVFNVYVIRQSEDGKFWLHHVYGKGYNDKKDGFVLKGINYDKYIDLMEQISYHLGLKDYSKYQNSIQRM